MSAQTRDARLRIPSFTAPPFAPTGDNNKDLIFILRTETVQIDVSDSVIAIPLPNWRGGVMVPLTIIKHQITITGVVYDRGHTAHPVATLTEHDPDMVDLEEAAVTWSGQAPGGPIEGPNDLVHLETEFNGNTWRTYQGVILSLTLSRDAAHTEITFALTFGVLFDARTFPGIREWV